MLTPNSRQRRARLFRWLLVVVVLAAAGGAAVYFYLKRVRFTADPALADELARSTLVEEPAETTPGEWPQWRGPRRDGFSTETGWLKDWPKGGPRVLWRQPCGEGYSSLAVAGGRLYTMEQAGADEAVVCRDAATGRELWRHAYPASYLNNYGGGPRATPTIDGGRVYAVGATGIFHCLDAVTGTLEWRHDLLDEFKAKNLQWGVSFSPLVEGDLVITNPGGPDGYSVVAFDKRDGRVVWHALDDPAGYSSPIAITAAGTRQVIVFTGKSLAGLSAADGTLFWRYPWETSYDVNAATPIHFRARSGDRTSDYLFISSGYDKGCAVLRVAASPDHKPEVKTVYAGTQMRNHHASCVRDGPHLYGFDDDRLACMDLRTGVISWTTKAAKKGSLLLADGHLIILSENGELVLAEASAEAYREKARARLRRGDRCWSVPTLAGARLYVRYPGEIVCLDLQGAPEP